MMSEDPEIHIYMCPRHLVAQAEPGKCPLDCTLDLIECCPGDPDDPCRRPVVDEDGTVRTRAPLWWLEHTVEELWPYLRGD